ncbi:MAG: glycosyltransferase family 2 protein [Brevefilum sp.]
MKSNNYPEISIVVPVYNESEIINDFHAQLAAVLDTLKNKSKIWYVDDGSDDGTAEVLAALADRDAQVRVLTLSRNFGHQAALTCGLDHAEGEVIITMDGDGQNPPEMIPEMLNLFQAGYDIVIGQRQVGTEEPFFKRVSSRFFYQLINRIGNLDITPNAADFRLLSRKVVDGLKKMPEYHRFLRGMISWVGFKSVILPYTPKSRLGGESKYTLKKMLKLAGDAIFSFSLVPLHIGLAIGGLFYFLALLEAIYVLSFWVTGNQPQLEPGWSSLMFMLLIVGGTLTTVVSFIGIYVGYIFQEVKNRPIYLLRDTEEEPSHNENMK